VKIAHLEYGRYVYGGARQVQHLVTGLAHSGVENVLICRPGSSLAHAPCAAKLVELPMYGDFDLGVVRRLRAVLRQERPDVLHVHSRGGVDVFGGLAGRAEGIATVLTRRVDNAEPLYWARFKYSNYDAVAAISRAIHTQLVDVVGLPAARVHRIASAVDAAGFCDRGTARKALAERYGIAQDEFVIGVVAQLIARKGHDVLLTALPAILRRHPRVRVLCFGRGPRAAALQRRIDAEPPLRQHVQLLGYEPALERLMPGFDLLVHPAQAEGLGVAVLEAMSCGVPVVASRVGGITDCIEHARTGILCQSGDDAALADATVALLDAPERRCGIARAAKASVSERNSIAAMTAAYTRLYAKLTGANHVFH
jgi:glycosyltransferase involved in cell wall biosynthesis